MEDAFRTTKKATEYNGDKLARHALDLKIRHCYVMYTIGVAVETRLLTDLRLILRLDAE